MRRCHAFTDLCRLGQLAESVRQRVPILTFEAQRGKELRLATVVRVRRIQQVVADFLTRDNRQMGVGYFI